MLPRLSAPVSGVDCPCPWIHANSLLPSRPAVQSPTLFCSPLCCPAPTALCWVATSTPPASSANCPLLGCDVNSHSRPLTTSGYGEISCPRILCLVSRQNRQRNHLLWQPIHIVLQHTHQAAKLPSPRLWKNMDL